MSIPLNINGTDYFYPQTGDINWGPDATDWAVAVTSGMLQKAGGLFQLLGEVDFGPNYGLKAISYKSRTADVSSTGTLRLAKTDVVAWRNNANNADLALSISVSDQLLFNGLPVGTITTISDTNSINLSLTGTDLTADLKLSAVGADPGYVPVEFSIETDGLRGQIDPTEIVADLPIADSTTTGLLSDTDWNIFNNKQAAGNYITSLTGDVTASGPGAAATTISAGVIVNSMVSASAAIAYSKLNLTGSIVNVDVNAAAAIAYSKLALSNSIVNADINTSAAIALSKLANIGANTILGNNTGGATPIDELTPTEVTAMLDAFVGDSGAGGLKGLVPAPGIGDNSKFLKGDGTWSSAGGGGGGSAFAFGGGTDGNVTVSSGTTVLTRDMFYNNLTISGTGSINPSGYRIYVAGILDLTAAPAGAISVAGGNGTTATSSGGTGGAGGTAAYTASGSIGGGLAGATGGNGSGTNGNNGSNGTSQNPGMGGNSGQASGFGGTGSGGTRGTGATGGGTTNGNPFVRYATDLIRQTQLLQGGATGGSGGGGSGGGGNGGGGGGSGASGGIIYLAANQISSSGATAGAITAKGGNGGGGRNAVGTTAGGGGGGNGAGGGWVYLIYGSKLDAAATDLIDASGGDSGAGGNGTNTGISGGDSGAGAAGGRITLFNLSTGVGAETFGGTATARNTASSSTGGVSVSGQSTKVSF